MKARRINNILQLAEGRRFAALAEGMQLLARNVAVLEADVAGLQDQKRHRSAAALRCFAEEEAAKVMILLDLARAGWSDAAATKTCFRRFYDHLARGLYVRVYDTLPADLGEVRGFVDMMRREFYLDGPMDVDWIFGNDVLSEREGRLYVDYVEAEHDECYWTTPSDMDLLAPSTIVRLVEALDRIGMLSERGLEATQHAWRTTAVADGMLWSDLRPLNITVVDEITAELWDDDASEKDARAAHYAVEHWSFPLTGLDLRISKVAVADLQHEREQRLAYEMGYYDDMRDIM